MEQLKDTFNLILPYFNVVLGVLMILIGFKIYRPIKKEKEEMFYKKFGDLYKYGGIAMLIWGVILVLNQLSIL